MVQIEKPGDVAVAADEVAVVVGVEVEDFLTRGGEEVKILVVEVPGDGISKELRDCQLFQLSLRA